MESTLEIAPKYMSLPISLLQLLSNTLVLDQTAPYLPLSSLFALGATAKSFRSLIRDTPYVFRYLDLTKAKSAQFEITAIGHGGEVWRNVQLDENITEDDFYGGPLQGIFSTLRRQGILQNVQTLILDGLSVTADLVSEIILQPHFNVRILSIREVQNLNERKLQQVLNYAVRPSRLADPKLQALYIFGTRDVPLTPRFPRAGPADVWAADGGVLSAPGAQIGAQWNQKSGVALASELACGADRWYQAGGKVLTKPPSWDWANTLSSCCGLISFDAVICHGPRHSSETSESKQHTPWYRSDGAHLSSRVATHSIGGCSSCGRAPEGIAKFNHSASTRFPLLAPPPLHSSTAKAAKTPFFLFEDKLLLRCLDCLRNRFCESCHRWWCEDCHHVPDITSGSSRLLENANVIAQDDQKLKVHMGLCVEECLVLEMMSGAGSNGMWG
ncbi:hypothetical protein BUE80_DR013340 [Diplocarpon rosae]|nr:hypothetical protein BUE80_DR013340 [Diplocarpon rosae]